MTTATETLPRMLELIDRLEQHADGAPRADRILSALDQLRTMATQLAMLAQDAPAYGPGVTPDAEFGDYRPRPDCTTPRELVDRWRHAGLRHVTAGLSSEMLRTAADELERVIEGRPLWVLDTSDWLGWVATVRDEVDEQ